MKKIPTDENNSEPFQHPTQSLPSKETVEPPKKPTASSWADQADEEDPLNSPHVSKAVSKVQENTKEWMKVSKKKKPPHSRQPVITRSHSGTVKELST